MTARYIVTDADKGEVVAAAEELGSLVTILTDILWEGRRVETVKFVQEGPVVPEGVDESWLTTLDKRWQD